MRLQKLHSCDSTLKTLRHFSKIRMYPKTRHERKKGACTVRETWQKWQERVFVLFFMQKQISPFSIKIFLEVDMWFGVKLDTKWLCVCWRLDYKQLNKLLMLSIFAITKCSCDSKKRIWAKVQYESFLQAPYL